MKKIILNRCVLILQVSSNVVNPFPTDTTIGHKVSGLCGRVKQKIQSE